MAKPLVISLPHQLGQKEAVRRIQSGLNGVRQKYSALISFDEETWADNRVTLRVRSVGQTAAAIIDIMEDHVRLEVTLPWLLHKFAQVVQKTIAGRGQILLEKK